MTEDRKDLTTTATTMVQQQQQPPNKERRWWCRCTIGRLRRQCAELRWVLGQHFHRRVVHALQDLQFVTFGQIFLILPLLACSAGGILTTWVHPNTSKSGEWAFYCLLLTFLFATKSNCSVFRWVLGLSWTQLVVHHHLATLFALLITVGHAYVAFRGTGFIQPERCMPGYVPPVDYDGDEHHRTLDEHEGGQHHRLLGDLCLEENPKFRHSLIGPDPDLWTFLWDGGRNFSGSAMTACLLALIATSSLRWFRHAHYDLWLVAHVALAGAALAYADKHRIGPLVWVTVVWWGLDGAIRYGVGTLCTHPKRATLTRISPDVVEISFPRGKFRFQAGQFVRIAFPGTRHPVMFHPLTISAAPYEETVTLHARALGGWTKYIADLCPSVVEPGQPRSAAASVDVRILIEGPYGSLPMDLWGDENHREQQRYPVVVLLCGGIGVAPMLSLARQLLHHEHEQQQRGGEGRGQTARRRLVHLIWVVRNLGLPRALLPLRIPGTATGAAHPGTDDEEAHWEETTTGAAQTPREVSSSKSMAKNESVEATVCDHPCDTLNVGVSNNNGERSSVFHGDLYVTDPKSCGDDDDDDADGDEDDATPILFQSEGFTLHSGRRPDIHSILGRAAAAESTVLLDGGGKSSSTPKQEQRIAVIACGPGTLTRDAKLACASHTRPGVVSLDFHEEVFLF